MVFPADFPRALHAVQTRLLFVMRLEVDAAQKLGGDEATQQVGVITGGSFEGERLRGVVLGGGSDWQTILSSRTVRLDCRLVLRTDDGAHFAMTYGGVRAGPENVLARLGRGEPVDPSEYYFRINPLFSTKAAAYAWLNDLIAVGTGHRLPNGPVYSVFELL